MKILLVGGSGFIGRHVTERLLSDGISPIVMDVRPPDFDLDFRGAGEILGQQALIETIDDIDVVVHLAWGSVPATADLDPNGDFNKNVVFSVNLLEACVRAKTMPRFVFISSGGAIYGQQSIIPTPENTWPKPIGAYGTSKLSVESYVELYSRIFGLKYIILRPSNPFGPHANLKSMQGFIPIAMSRIFNKQPVEVWGGGEVIRDYLFVDDLADAVLKAITSVSKPGLNDKIYNIGTGKGTSISMLLKLFQEITGENFQIKMKGERSMELPVSVLDSTLANEKLGWSPKVSLKDGLARTWRWIIK